MTIIRFDTIIDVFPISNLYSAFIQCFVSLESPWNKFLNARIKCVLWKWTNKMLFQQKILIDVRMFYLFFFCCRLDINTLNITFIYKIIMPIALFWVLFIQMKIQKKTNVAHIWNVCKFLGVIERTPFNRLPIEITDYSLVFMLY